MLFGKSVTSTHRAAGAQVQFPLARRDSYQLVSGCNPTLGPLLFVDRRSIERLNRCARTSLTSKVHGRILASGLPDAESARRSAGAASALDVSTRSTFRLVIGTQGPHHARALRVSSL